MKQYDGLDNYIKNDGTILVLGMFDGIHIGHKALFDKAEEIKGDSTVTVLTFNNHFDKDKSNHKMLMTVNEKLNAICDLNVDEVIIENVDNNLISTTAEEFIKILENTINIKGIVVGYDYTFGKGGLGTPDMLLEHFNNVFVIDEITRYGEKISSTSLRECLKNLDFEKYMELSVKPYFISGVVQHGCCIGRQHETPTINVKFDKEKLLPKDGIYISRIKIGNKIYDSISNLGSAPTFDRDEQILEVHVFDFNEAVYDKMVEVYFYKYIREIKKFNSCDELYAQVGKDIKETKNYFKDLK